MNSKHSRANTIRGVVAGAFIFIGLFVTLFGIGYGRISVVLVGVALLLLSVSGRLITTLRGTVRQWVVGKGRVVHVSDPPPSTPYGRCELELVIDVPGLPRDAVILREPRVPVDNWPRPGQVLPIEVAADDIRNVRILWQDRPEDQETDEVERDHAVEPWPGPPPTGEAEPDDIDFDLDGPPTPPARAGGARVPRPRPGPAPHAPAHVPGRAATTTLAGWSTEPAAAPAGGPTADAPDAHRAVRGVGATLMVTDLDRSTAFYRDLLGFRVIDRDDATVVLASAGIRLVLRRYRQMDRVRQRLVHLHLEVGDVDSAYVALKAAGATFISAPRVVTGGSQLEQWAALLRDPDGHGIALTQWR